MCERPRATMTLAPAVRCGDGAEQVRRCCACGPPGRAMVMPPAPTWRLRWMHAYGACSATGEGYRKEEGARCFDCKIPRCLLEYNARTLVSAGGFILAPWGCTCGSGSMGLHMPMGGAKRQIHAAEGWMDWPPAACYGCKKANTVNVSVEARAPVGAAVLPAGDMVQRILGHATIPATHA